jgi:hypothetical protein
MRICWLLVLAGLAGCASRERPEEDYFAIREAQVAALVVRGTPESLASASILVNFERDSQALTLINRAVALAPGRGEFTYLRWRLCAIHQCAEEAQFIRGLKAIDPRNGAAWLPELQLAWDQGDQRQVTEIISKIGSTRGPYFYWNSLVVMMVDSLADAPAPAPSKRAEDLPARMTAAMGAVSSVAIPPLYALGKSCHLDQFDQPGRRFACEAMTSQLLESDTMIMQGLALSIRQRWWSDGSPERVKLQTERLQFDYLRDASLVPRLFHFNSHFATRLAAMRGTDSEAQVARAMLISYHKPVERPLNWKDPFQR